MPALFPCPYRAAHDGDAVAVREGGIAAKVVNVCGNESTVVRALDP